MTQKLICFTVSTAQLWARTIPESVFPALKVNP